MENNSPTYVVQLQYLGEPSIALDEQIEEYAFIYGLEPGVMSWDEETFVRDVEFPTGNLSNANDFINRILQKYNGLCHARVDTRY